MSRCVVSLVTNKRCSQCSRIRDRADFYKKGERLDSCCKDCKRNKRNLRYKKDKKTTTTIDRIYEPETEHANYKTANTFNANFKPEINAVSKCNKYKSYSDLKPSFAEKNGNPNISAADFDLVVVLFNNLAKWRDEEKLKKNQDDG